MSGQIKSPESGKCPICGSDNVDYGNGEPTDGSQYKYEITCNACGWSGFEWYNMDFIGFTDWEGNNISSTEKEG